MLEWVVLVLCVLFSISVFLIFDLSFELKKQKDKPFYYGYYLYTKGYTYGPFRGDQIVKDGEIVNLKTLILNCGPKMVDGGVNKFAEGLLPDEFSENDDLAILINKFEMESPVILKDFHKN
jgi:hypothetical protein